MHIIKPIRNFYNRFERRISSVFLVGGFVFDILTLRRVDALWENLWISGYVVLAALIIFLMHTRESKVGDENNPNKMQFWYANALQFCFGGLLSANLIFYFRSADIMATWPFVLLLAIAFYANESLREHYARFSFQLSLFFLSVYSFMIFLVPVVIRQIGTWVFLLSGFLSLLFIGTFIAILFHFIKGKNNEQRHERKQIIVSLVLGIFALVNFLYFTNLIPPIPLSLKDAGVYHSITKNREGNYQVTYEDYGIRGYFKLYKEFHLVPGSAVYAYSAIFSPRGLNINIIHDWQRYDESLGGWVSESIINLPVVGGRDGGFRTYSVRSNLAPGKWRVGMKTEQGQLIGYLRFKIVQADTKPELSLDTKE